MAKNWLDKYEYPKAQNGIEGTMGGLTDKGFNYNGAWGGPSMQMGGNIQPPMAGADQTVPMGQKGVSVDLNGEKEWGDYTIVNPKDPDQRYPVYKNDIEQIVATAIGMGYDPKTAMAVALQETGAGKSDPNFFHVLHGPDLEKKYWNLPHDEAGIQMLIDKKAYANKLGYTTPELELQAFNGLGKIFPETEQNYHGFKMKKAYGVPVPKEGIDMKKNPLYGKRILGIKDSIVENEPFINETIEKYKKFYNNPDSTYFTRASQLPEIEIVPEFTKLPKWNYANEWLENYPEPSASGFWDKWKNGGSLPGSVGFTYARTKGIPSEGPYGKKTVPSAQNGQEMQFYQNGLDWTPRNISEYGSEIPMAQPGITQPMRGDIQTRGNQNLLTEIAAQRTKEKKAQEARTRTTIGADTRTAKQKEKDRQAYESKVKYEKEVLGKDFETPQYLQEKNRARAEHLLRLADVGTMGAGLVEGVGKLALKNVPKPVTAPDKITPVVNTTRNLEDLQAAQTFAQKYGYELPTNLERISQSDELTNRTIRGMMNRHNTFVRGVSTNWEAIGKKNPEILRHLEGKGIDWQNNPKAAAEYMATHIPISTGYGRASLNRDVFDQGLEGLYTSNSIPTAEGYTYGQGFITKVKRPTNYSSANRQDWITQNNPEYYEHSLPGGNSLMVDGKITQPINMKLPYLYNVKDYDNINVFKDKVLKDLEKNASDLKSMFEERALSNPTYSQNLKNSYDEITKRIQDIKAQKWETADVKFDKNLLKTEHLPKVDESIFRIGDNSTTIKTIHDEIIPKLKLSPKEDLQLKSDLIAFTEGYRKQGLNIKQIGEKLKLYLKEQYYNDPYAHYIHLGTPGQKVLEPIKSWEITPEIWKNQSRAHTNKYTKKLSALEEGGVVKDNMGYWNPDNWGKVVEIDSPNITMKGVNQDLIGVSDEGDVQYMTPGNDYKFKGKKVKEYPVAKYGVNQQDEKTVQHLDQLLNFTNKPKAKNGWLSKYE